MRVGKHGKRRRKMPRIPVICLFDGMVRCIAHIILGLACEEQKRQNKQGFQSDNALAFFNYLVAVAVISNGFHTI
jgi:hypothetical protein